MLCSIIFSLQENTPRSKYPQERWHDGGLLRISQRVIAPIHNLPFQPILLAWHRLMTALDKLLVKQISHKGRRANLLSPLRSPLPARQTLYHSLQDCIMINRHRRT
ncbi:hypothetical protein D3C81_1644670 [compost metagenome]